MASMESVQIKSIYFFNDYIYEFDIIYGNNYITINDQDQVKVCGLNQCGGLGLGHKNPIAEPVLNPDLSNKEISQFFRGFYCMFARNEQDEFYCWGDNETGQLGLGEKQLEKDVKPNKNEFLSNKNIVELFCGREESVALNKNGQVYFWIHVGNTGFAQKCLIQTPQLNICLSKINQLDCGLYHFMALTTDNILLTWGKNNYGQLGCDSPRFKREPIPIDHSGIEIVQIICGGLSSYYLSADKCVYFCGHCLTEEENRMSCFTKIDFEPIIQLISVKPYYYVLAQSEDQVYELGKFDLHFTRTAHNDYDNYLCDEYQITNGTLNYDKHSLQDKIENKTALDYLNMFTLDMKNKIKILNVFNDNYGKNIIYVNQQDEVYVTGSNQQAILGDGTDETLTLQYKIDEISHIGVDSFYTGIYCIFAKTVHDQIYCWGKNYFGLLGLGFETDSQDYIDVQRMMGNDRNLYKVFPHLKPGLNPYLSNKGILEIYCYENTNFAITSYGHLYGWGLNSFWQMPNNSSMTVSTPAQVIFAQDHHLVKFSTGLNHFMVLDSQGKLFGWGSNHWNQLNNYKNQLNYKEALTLFKEEILVNSDVEDFICHLNKSFVLTKDKYLHIHGEGLRYLKLSTLNFSMEREITSLKLIPNKQLVICSKSNVFEQFHLGYFEKTKFDSYQDYLNNKFSPKISEICQTVKTVQFENMVNFELNNDNKSNYKQESIQIKSLDQEKANKFSKVLFKSRKKFNCYDVLERIGQGSFGKVYKIKDHLSERLFALKCIPLKGDFDESNELFNEIQILAKIQSDYIVEYYYAEISANYLNIKMEYCECYGLNTLRDLINSESNYFNTNEDIELNLLFSNEVLREIAEGLLFLHTHSTAIVHGDLKLNNIFLKRSDSKFLKIGDFGLAKFVQSNIYSNVPLDGLSSKYLAPEILARGEYSIYSDLYSFGVIGEEINHDNLYQYTILIKFEDSEPKNRITCSQFLIMTEVFFNNHEQVQNYLKNLDIETLEKKISSKFISEFLQSKLKLERHCTEQFKHNSEDIDNLLSDTYENIISIGKGSFGEVFKVKSKIDEQVYAVKRILKKVFNLDEEKELKREIEILTELRDDKLLQYKNCWIDSDQVYIQMEFCQFDLGLMFEPNKKPRKRVYFNRNNEEEGFFGYLELIELSISCEIFQKITSSLKTLHELGIIHRDLKPGNILIKVSKDVTFKIADFGLSKYYNQAKSNTKDILATNKYEAPEFRNNKKYNLKADIFSLGKILLDLLDIDHEHELDEEDMYFGDETTDVYQNEIIKLIEDMINENEFDLRPDCFEIITRLKSLKLNWERVKDLNYEGRDEKLSNKVVQLELDDIFIKILTDSDGLNSLSFKKSPRVIDEQRNRKLKRLKSAKNKIQRKSYKMDYDELELCRTGGFGFIFKSKHKLDHHVYAIKKLYLGSMAINNRERNLIELERFAKLDNIHIAQYKVSWLEKNIIYNQMEFCETYFGEIIIRRLEIFNRLKDQAMSVCEYFVYFELFREWVKALDYLHSYNPPLTSAKLNKPLISLNHPSQFLRLVDIQERQNVEILNTAIFGNEKDIGQILKNAPHIFCYDVSTKESISIKSSEFLRSKHDQIRELIFYQKTDINVDDKNPYIRKLTQEVSLKENRAMDEQSMNDMVNYVDISEISMQTSTITTKSILSALDELEIKDEKELRGIPEFPIIVSHLKANEEIIFKIFEGKFKNRFNTEI